MGRYNAAWVTIVSGGTKIWDDVWSRKVDDNEAVLARGEGGRAMVMAVILEAGDEMSGGGFGDLRNTRV